MDKMENLLNGAIDDLEDIDPDYLSPDETQELIDHAISLLTEALQLP